MEEKSRCNFSFQGKTALFCRQLQKSPSSYFNGVYMTFLSVFQGLILAKLLDSLFSSELDLISKICLHLPAIIFIIIVWHNYMNHHQFLAWQIQWKDTLIVFSFGLVEAVTAFWLINDQNPIYVCIMIIFGGIIGMIAYIYAYSQLQEEYVFKIYRNHYSCDDKRCKMASYIWQLMSDFQIFATLSIVLFSATNCIFIALIFITYLSKSTPTNISLG